MIVVVGAIACSDCWWLSCLWYCSVCCLCLRMIVNSVVYDTWYLFVFVIGLVIALLYEFSGLIVFLLAL